MIEIRHRSNSVSPNAMFGERFRLRRPICRDPTAVPLAPYLTAADEQWLVRAARRVGGRRRKTAPCCRARAAARPIQLCGAVGGTAQSRLSDAFFAGTGRCVSGARGRWNWRRPWTRCLRHGFRHCRLCRRRGDIRGWGGRGITCRGITGAAAIAQRNPATAVAVA